MALTIAEMVDGLKATRAELGRLFLQAQQEVGFGADRRQILDAVAPTLPDRAAFIKAFEHAQVEKFLPALIQSIVAEGLEDGRLTNVKFEEGGTGLEAMIGKARGFMEPYVAAKGITNSLRWIAKIEVDREACGTGILIGPHLVLTAWHVVRPLFQRDDRGAWQPDPDGAERLRVIFDDHLMVSGGSSTLRTRPARIVAAHPNWCPSFAPCHSDELLYGLPARLSELEGLWDFAVICLKEALGLERRWASFDAPAVVPKAGEPIVLFQHAAGQTLRLDQNTIAAPAAHQKAAVPSFRFLHLANSLKGSSGGPCFDKSFVLFGLHQGEWQERPGAAVPAAGAVAVVPAAAGAAVTKMNRGIPIDRIRTYIRASTTPLPDLGPLESPVWEISEGNRILPVLGAERFREVVWRSAVNGTPRLLSIGGPPGSGKSFWVKLLPMLLLAGQHLKITIEAEVIAKKSASEIAEHICKVAGAPVPAFASTQTAATTPTAWFKDEIVDKLIVALDSVRQGRQFWLALTNLNKAQITGPGASDMLFVLYDQIRTSDWLRIVLDGMQGDIPLALERQRLVERVRTADITRAEIEAYFRRFDAEMELSIDDRSLMVVSGLVEQTYTRILNGSDSAMATTILAEEVMSTALAYLRA